MNYQRTQWTPGMRITSDGLNNIESGITDLYIKINEVLQRVKALEDSGVVVTSEKLEELGAVMYNHQVNVGGTPLDELTEIPETTQH